ncbi:unnamed protein product [Musa hybrid cultivar]
MKPGLAWNSKNCDSKTMEQARLCSSPSSPSSSAIKNARGRYTRSGWEWSGSPKLAAISRKQTSFPLPPPALIFRRSLYLQI